MNFLQNNFKYIRELKGLNQVQASVLFGFNRSVWNNYETGKSKPNISDFVKISEYFGFSIDDLLNKDLQNVHLNKNNEVLKEGKNVHLNVHPSVHLNAKNTKNYNLPEDGSNMVVNEPTVEYNRAKNPSNEAVQSSNLIANLTATNTYLLSRVAVLEQELSNLKREIPQIGQSLDDKQDKRAG